MEKDITIGQIVADNYSTAAIFREFDIDFCCGGQKLFKDVCSEKGIEEDILIKRLNEVSIKKGPVQDNFNRLSMVSLTDYIIRVHHGYILGAVPDILFYTGKIAEVHGKNHKELAEVAGLFSRAADGLLVHMKKEEEEIFPAIRDLSGNNVLVPVSILSAELETLTEEHKLAGNLLAQIRGISGNYTLPEDGCNSWRLAYSMLENFENDLHMHVHLENNILFPKVSETIKNLK